MSKVLKRELQVAFSKKSQPVWFRVMKYVLIGSALYLFWGSPWLWISLAVFFVIAMALHFWYRYKTKGWTQSYGMWKHH